MRDSSALDILRQELPYRGYVLLHGCPHPMRVERVREVVPCGNRTLSDIVEQGCNTLRVPRALRQYGHAWVDGKYIPHNQWDTLRPSPWSSVAVRMVPQGGGGGGKAARAVLTIGVIAAAIAFGPALGVPLSGIYNSALAGTFGAMSVATGAMVGSALIFGAGMLAVDMLVPVQAAKLPTLSAGGAGAPESPVHSLSGMRNQKNPYGPVPMVLGDVRYSPYYGADPYTEIAGNDQFLRLDFVHGYGELEISEPRLGETPLEEYVDVEIQQTSGADGVVLDLYPQDIYEDTPNIMLQHEEPITRRTLQEVTSFSVDIVFPRLVTFSDSGSKGNRTCEVWLEYRAVGSAEWVGPYEIPAQSVKRFDSYDARDAYVFYAVTVNPKTGSVIIRTASISKNSIEIGSQQKYGFSFGNPLSWPFVNEEYSVTIQWKDRGEHFVSVLGYSILWGGGGIDNYNPYERIVHDITEREGFTGGDVEWRLERIQDTWYGKPQYFIHADVDDIFVEQENNVFRATAATTEPLRLSKKIDVPKGQYEIRMTRKTPHSSSTKVYDDVQWSVLRSIKPDEPVNVDYPLARTQMRIKASEQLSGVVDDFNARNVLRCLDWDRDIQQWVVRATTNPASLFRWVLQGPALKRPKPDNRIDLQQLELWHEFCDDNGFSFSQVRDFQRGVYAALSEIAAAGRASVVRPDGKWSVVYDDVRDYVAWDFTAANTWGYSCEITYPDEFHAYRVRYTNREIDFQQDELTVFADGYSEANATLFEALELPGVCDAEQAYKLARYHMAVRKLRRERHSFYCDFEHIICTRGDLVTLAHPVPLIGGSQGRIKSVYDDESGYTVAVVDEPCNMEAGVDYVLRYRNRDGSRGIRTVHVAQAGEQTEIYLVPDASGIEPSSGDYFMFGERGLEVTELIVTRIEPAANNDAKITCVNYAPEVFDAASGPIPAFNPAITTPPSFGGYPAPPVPRIISVVSDESAMVRGTDGTLQQRVLVTCTTGSGRVAVAGYSAEYRTNGGPWRTAQSVDAASSIALTDVSTGDVVDIRVRSVAQRGQSVSDWTYEYGHVVVGPVAPPPDVDGMLIERGVLTWVYPDPPIDFAGFSLRWHTGSNRNWPTATQVNGDLISGTRYDVSRFAGAGIVTFLLCAVDRYGNESSTTAFVTTEISDSAPENIIETIYQNPDFLGTVVSGEKYFDSVVAESTSFWSGVDSNLIWTGSDNADWYTSTFLPVEYTWSWVVPDWADGLDATISKNTLGQFSFWYAADSNHVLWSGEDDAWFWSGTDDNVWFYGKGAWHPWPGTISLKSGTVLYFRAYIDGGTTQGTITEIGVTIDAPDKRQIVSDLPVDVSGVTVSLPSSWTAVKNVKITIQDTGGGATGAGYLSLNPLVVRTYGGSASLDLDITGY